MRGEMGPHTCRPPSAPRSPPAAYCVSRSIISSWPWATRVLS